MIESTRLIVYLAQKGASNKEIEVTTTEIAKDMNSTQQTVSRRLSELEEAGIVQRISSTRGIRVKLSEKGISELRSFYSELKNIFTKRPAYIHAVVESGIGEGSYYVSLPEYVEQFQKKLNISPYKGTLNLKIDQSEFFHLISNQQKITIKGFSTPTRTFGSITAYKIRLNEIPSAIIIPERTHHNKNIIEVISNIHLRKSLNLKDADSVRITLG